MGTQFEKIPEVENLCRDLGEQVFFEIKSLQCGDVPYLCRDFREAICLQATRYIIVTLR